VTPRQEVGKFISDELRKAGYLVVSEAELATALTAYALSDDPEFADDTKYGPILAIALPTGAPHELAAGIFAALVSAQEKGGTGS
jgi:hypothetical protein